MARKRMIDPDIWSDDKVLALSWNAVPFYVGLISQADDQGRLKFSAVSLRAKICPREDVSVADVEGWMWECVDAGLVLVYQVESTLFALLPGWGDYQKVQHPTESRVPAPPENLHEESRKLHESSRKFVKPHESSPQVRSVRSVRLDQIGGAKVRTRPTVSESDLPRFGDLESDIVAFVATIAAENKTGKIAMSRELAVRKELESRLSELGRDAFAYGLRECNRRAKPNVNYLRACAANYTPDTRPPSRLSTYANLRVVGQA